MGLQRKLLPLLAALMIAMIMSSAASAAPPATEPVISRLVTGLEGGSGSTVGPGGALYVTEGIAGRISRVDPRTGDKTTFASGLPKRIVANGGAMDVAFIGKTAYVLVTLVGTDVGGHDIVGIYRVDGPNSFTVIADIGAFSVNHPPKPTTSPVVPTGVQYALETYRGGFLVTDGNHNRVLRVTRDGQITELIAFGNIVPTGLEVAGNTVYMAEAGPVPHLPEDGKIVSFKPKSPIAREIASGGRLLVDVELGRGTVADRDPSDDGHDPGRRDDGCHRTLYALAQGVFPVGNPPGSPALPNTGKLLKVNDNDDHDGTFTVVVDQLNQPTSLEFIGKTAYVVTLTGEIWKIDNVAGLSCGMSR